MRNAFFLGFRREKTARCFLLDRNDASACIAICLLFFHHVFGCFILCLCMLALGSVGLLCLVCLSGRLICMITVRCLWHGTNVTRLRIYGCSSLWLPVCIRFVLHIQVSDDDDDAAEVLLWTWYMDRSMDVEAPSICRAIAGDYITAGAI